ncbi:MAG: hypothetical protein WCB85_10445 [Candidatus Dormiibacterota bacterium]
MNSVGAPASTDGEPDLEAIVAEIQDDVERKRASEAYPASLLERLGAEFHPDEGLEPPETAVLIESARPIRSTQPVVGGAVVFAKRALRRLISWYVAPIARDQTRFNLAILRELRSLERRVARLEEPAQGTAEDHATTSGQ